ncbi:hypothetical protein Tco_1325186, partial [Tanacetum coccineum]
ALIEKLSKVCGHHLKFVSDNRPRVDVAIVARVYQASHDDISVYAAFTKPSSL